MTNPDMERIVGRIKAEEARQTAITDAERVVSVRASAAEERQRVEILGRLTSDWLGAMRAADFPEAEILTIEHERPAGGFFTTRFVQYEEELAVWLIGQRQIKPFEALSTDYPIATYIYLTINGQFLGQRGGRYISPPEPYTLGTGVNSEPGSILDYEWRQAELAIPGTLTEIAARAEGVEWSAEDYFKKQG